MTWHAHRLDDEVLVVRGDDARDWLQGQLTCDLSKPATASVYGLVLSGTGHILSDVWVSARDDAFVLRVGAPLAELLPRLDRYIVMEDVELEPAARHIVHVWPDDAALDAAAPGLAAFDPLPTPRLRPHGLDLTTGDVEQTLRELAGVGVVVVDEARWERERVALAVPRLGRDFGAQTLPQEAGLKRAVSFQKGCYFGQEPVVMLEHRGKPPKRLVHFTFAAQRPADRDARAVTDADGRVVGEITSLAGEAGLALVKRRALEAGGLRFAGVAPATLAPVE